MIFTCGIYKIISPSGKIYIGQSDKIQKRWYFYKGMSCKSQPRLYRSFLKYGVINHIFEIIEECSYEDLDCRERYWQDFYDVLNREKGLNLVLTECNGKKREYLKNIEKKCQKLD